MNAALHSPAGRVLLMLCSLGLMLSWIDERMFWPYMLSAYLAATIVYFLDKAERDKKGALIPYLFPRSVWMHPSAIQDYWISIINFFLPLSLFHAAAVSPETVSRIVLWMESFLDGQHLTRTPPLVASIAYTVCALLLSDLFYYFSHRLTHKIPALWEFHKVHHSAEVMTPVTVYRMHPVDLWLNQSFRALGLGLAAGIFLFIYPNAKGFMTVAGVSTTLLLSGLLVANLRHSHIWISFGALIEHIFISPAQHQIHHSKNPKHFDKNYGSLFALWDWMFGSLYVPQEKETIAFGLREDPAKSTARTVPGMYIDPVKNLIRIMIGNPAS